MSDPNLAPFHAAGTQVKLFISTLHDAYGAVNIEWRRTWVVHLDLWEEAMLELEALDKEILLLDPGTANVRAVSDEATIRRMFRAGVEVLTNSVLTMQHLAAEIESHLPGSPDFSELDPLERLNKAASEAGLVQPNQLPGWDSLVELKNYRDYLNHPHHRDLYGSAHDGSWRRTTLGYLVSGAALKASRPAFDLMLAFANTWEDRQSKAAAGKTLTFKANRGIRSLEPVKKASEGRSE